MGKEKLQREAGRITLQGEQKGLQFISVLLGSALTEKEACLSEWLMFLEAHNYTVTWRQ